MSSFASGGSGSDLTSPLHSPRMNGPRSRRVVAPYPDALTSPPAHATEPSGFSTRLRSNIHLGVQTSPSPSASSGPFSPSQGESSPSVVLNFGQLSITSPRNGSSPSAQFMPPPSSSGIPVPQRVRSASLSPYLTSPQSAQASPGVGGSKLGSSMSLKRDGFVEPFAPDTDIKLVQDSDSYSHNRLTSDETRNFGFSFMSLIPPSTGMPSSSPSGRSSAHTTGGTERVQVRSTQSSRKSAGSSDAKSLSPSRAKRSSSASRGASPLKKSASSVGLVALNSSTFLSASSLTGSNLGGNGHSGGSWVSSPGEHSSSHSSIPAPDSGEESMSSPLSKSMDGDEQKEQKKGPWIPEEHNQLLMLVESHGPKDWSYIAQHMPGRIGKQCRERYFNHLAPDVRKESWSPEEDEAIIRAHSTWGNKWTLIAKILSNGRPPNAIKNRWNSSLKKRAESDSPQEGSRGTSSPSPPSPSVLSTSSNSVSPLPPLPTRHDEEKGKAAKDRGNNVVQVAPPQPPTPRRHRKARGVTAAPVPAEVPSHNTSSGVITNESTSSPMTVDEPQTNVTSVHDPSMTVPPLSAIVDPQFLKTEEHFDSDPLFSSGTTGQMRYSPSASPILSGIGMVSANTELPRMPDLPDVEPDHTQLGIPNDMIVTDPMLWAPFSESYHNDFNDFDTDTGFL